jgi:hypothetical protein
MIKTEIKPYLEDWSFLVGSEGNLKVDRGNLKICCGGKVLLREKGDEKLGKFV